MRCSAWFLFFVSYLVYFQVGQSIILNNQEITKPAYTSGIKTTSWKSPNRIETHQNYSKVYVHNNASNTPQYVITTAEKSERVYPIYNAHSYQIDQSQKINTNSQLRSNSTRGPFGNILGGSLAGTHKNRTIYKRKIEYKTIEVYEKCPEGATGAFVYYLSCNQFLNCWKGRGDVQNCAPGTLFNPKTLECDFPDKVECVTGRQNSLSLQTTRSQKSIIQATCPQGFSGLIPNYTDCSKFINCNNGIQNSMDCPPGTLFDTTKNVCNFPYLTTCFNGQSGGSQSGGNSGQYGQNLGQYHQQGSLNGYGGNQGHQTQQYGYFQGQNTHGSSQNQGAQTGGQYYQTSYGSQRQNCNPQTQNCGFQGRQGTQHSSGVNQYGRTDGQYQYGSSSQVDSKLDFSESGGTHQTSYGQVPTNRGQRLYIQTTHGSSNCNPQTQNCAQNFPSTSGHGYGQSIAPSCDPRTQNCGQRQGSNHQQGYGQSSSQSCNPQIQNCEQTYSSTNSQSYGQRFVPSCDPRNENCGQYQGSNHQQGYGQSSVPSCNPQTENCGQTYSSTNGKGYGQSSVSNCDPRIQNCGNHQPDYGRFSGQNSNPQTQNSAQGYGTTQIHGSGQFQFGPTCNPQDQRCLQSYGSTQQGRANGQSQSTTSGQNFHKICNINDLNCQNNRTTIPKKTKEPKCPENFQGITKHPSDCKKFLNCANGRTFIQDCAPGTLFNPTIGNCDFPYNVDCSNETEETTERYATSDWERIYYENSRKYGQNAGHGNIREGTTPVPQYQPSYTTNQGSYNQGSWQRTHSQGQGSSYQSQGQNSNSQGHNVYQGYPILNQGSVTKAGVKTSQGQTVTIVQTLTPRPTQVPYIPADTVVNRGQIGLVTRPTPIDKINNPRDYDDIFNPSRRQATHSTTPRSAGVWPPPFPSADVNADYIFEYDDGEPVTLEPENVFRADDKKKKKAYCNKDDFNCSADMCITQTSVCDGQKDCQSGKDEIGCQDYLNKFAVSKNSQLNILEDQRWVNVSQATCALLCIRSTSFQCRSFNYRKIDRTCFLSNLNIGLTGALREYYPFDYYELKSASIDCNLMFKCSNDKCISNHQLCDGFADCLNREDEKNCRAEDFGYSIRLRGTPKSNEGRVEVTAFGKTGYICDDNFGIKDANVICRELGFDLGAAEIRGHSHYATDIKERNTLYMIDDLDCVGNETTLLDCDFPGWGVHNCRDQEIAGVVCKTPQEKCGKNSWKCDSGNNECIPYSFVCDGLFDCTDDSDEGVQHCEAPTELRLVNGSNHKEGRVEIKHHGIWGTICDDDFNEDAAKVVCKYFGFKGTATLKKEAYFGPGEGPIWLDQVSCYGNETDLRKCTHWDWGEHNCDHSEDVGVICSNELDEVQLQRHSKLNDRYTTNTGLSPTSCGFRKDNQFLENDLIHARVVGGGAARKGDYPWQAALRIKGKSQKSHHWCGAVILSSQWVLTAAHCLLGYAKGAYMIVAGEYNTDEDEGTEQTKYIEEYFTHQNFTEGERVMKNDIALIKLKGTGFLLNKDIQPICLPDEDVDYERELNCTISGFGSVKTGNSAYSHNMMAAWIPIIRTDICKMPHVYDTAMSEGMICAGFLSGGVDSCHGDSGGPLACLDNGLFTLYGITSWGHRCGFANKPGVYVKVAHYRKWIDETIKRNS